MASIPDTIVVTKHGKRVERPTTPEEKAWYAANLQRHAQERSAREKRRAALADLNQAERMEHSALADRVQALIEVLRER